MKRQRGSSVERVLEMLEAVATAPRPVTVAELNQELNLPKATAHRLAATLEDKGFIKRQLNGRRFTPGPRFQRIALGVLGNSAFQARRHAILTKLADSIGETCNISLPDGDAMIYFDRVEVDWPLRISFPIGSRVPLHCTAAGKLYLGMLPPEFRRGLVDQLPLKPYSPQTVVERGALNRMLDTIHDEKVSYDNEEFIEGMVAIAVPVQDNTGKFCATLSFYAPKARTDLDTGRTHIPLMRRAARDLAALLIEGQAEDE